MTIITPGIKEVFRAEIKDAPLHLETIDEEVQSLVVPILGNDLVLLIRKVGSSLPPITPTSWAVQAIENTKTKETNYVQIHIGYTVEALACLGLSETAIRAALVTNSLGKLILDKQRENILECTDATHTDSLKEDISSALEYIDATFSEWKENAALGTDAFYTLGEVSVLYKKADGKVYFIIKGKEIPLDNPFLIHLYSAPTNHLDPEALRKIANYLIKQQEARLLEAKRRVELLEAKRRVEDGIYLRPEKTFLARPLFFTSDGDILVYLTRKDDDGIIGKGGEKTVKMAKSLRTGKLYATYTIETQKAEKALNRIRRFETLAGSHLRITYVTTYLKSARHIEVIPESTGLELSPDEITEQFYKTRITTEYYAHGDLFRAIIKDSLTLEQKKEIFKQIIIAIAKQHTLGLIHRDIKPANIFLGKDAVIGDLEMACSIDDTKRKSKCLGTMLYMSPEYLKAWAKKHKNVRSLKEAICAATTPAHDTWAVGCTLAELLRLFPATSPDRGCLLPWAYLSEQDLINYFTKGGPVFGELPKNSPQELVARMLDRNPSTRITLDEACKRLPKLDWDALRPFAST